LEGFLAPQATTYKLIRASENGLNGHQARRHPNNCFMAAGRSSRLRGFQSVEHGLRFSSRCKSESGARKLSWKEVAESFQTSWEKVCDSVEYVVEWGLEHRTLGPIFAIGVDEIQYAKGHKYLTLVYQIDDLT
jgi:hypothetical protein